MTTAVRYETPFLILMSCHSFPMHILERWSGIGNSRQAHRPLDTQAHSSWREAACKPLFFLSLRACKGHLWFMVLHGDPLSRLNHPPQIYTEQITLVSGNRLPGWYHTCNPQLQSYSSKGESEEHQRSGSIPGQHGSNKAKLPGDCWVSSSAVGISLWFQILRKGPRGWAPLSPPAKHSLTQQYSVKGESLWWENWGWLLPLNHTFHSSQSEACILLAWLGNRLVLSLFDVMGEVKAWPDP